MNPLSALYGSRDSGTERVLRSRCVVGDGDCRGPVVSIGNIAAGGSGKTPFVIALGEMLKRRGVSFDVLSRGLWTKNEGRSAGRSRWRSRRLRRRASADCAQAGSVGGHRRRSLRRRQIRRREFWPATASAGRWLPASRPGARLRHRAGERQRAGRTRRFPWAACVSRLLALARADAIVLTNDASADGLPLDASGRVAGAPRHRCSASGRALPGVLRDRAPG